jgi:DNA-binding NtrC family response regulator
MLARAIYDAKPRGGSCLSIAERWWAPSSKASDSGTPRARLAATENKKGLVELADGGTAFFDEIGDLPFEMQVKPLRLVQEKKFRAVGFPQ